MAGGCGGKVGVGRGATGLMGAVAAGVGFQVFGAAGDGPGNAGAPLDKGDGFAGCIGAGVEYVGAAAGGGVKGGGW